MNLELSEIWIMFILIFDDLIHLNIHKSGSLRAFKIMNQYIYLKLLNDYEYNFLWIKLLMWHIL